MFQKWLIAFLADRGWRYLQQRRTRKQLGRVIEKRSRKQMKRMRREQTRNGFKPGRALTLMALGAGAYAYYRSRQQSAWNDQFSTPPPSTSNPTALTSSAAATASTPVTASTNEPQVMAPFYNAGAGDLAPATLGDTAMLVDGDADALPPEADMETPAPDADVDPLAPAPDAPTYVTQSSLDESDTLAVPAANPEDDVAEAIAPTYNAQASLDDSTLAVPAANPEDDIAANPEDDVAADADALNEQAARNAAATDVAAKEAPDDQRI